MRVIDEFVPNWRSKEDKLSFHAIAPDRRPIEVTIMEAPLPDVELLELAKVHLSAPEGKINSIRLGRLYAQGTSNMT